MTDFYYTTQTGMADHIAHEVYGAYYVYIAADYDAADNHPSSNPKRVAAQWCAVAAGSKLQVDLDRLDDHRDVLIAVAAAKYTAKTIDLATFLKVKERIENAPASAFAPVIYRIERTKIAAGRLHAGDFAPANFPNHWEAIIRDLKEGEFEREAVTC